MVSGSGGIGLLDSRARFDEERMLSAETPFSLVEEAEGSKSDTFPEGEILMNSVFVCRDDKSGILRGGVPLSDEDNSACRSAAIS